MAIRTEKVMAPEQAHPEMQIRREDAHATLAAIQAWPHWPEIGKVAAKEYGMDAETFALNLPELQRFLNLICIGYHHLGMFSADIDAIWHSLFLSMTIGLILTLSEPACLDKRSLL